jgi:hypothetical protein
MLLLVAPVLLSLVAALFPVTPRASTRWRMSDLDLTVDVDTSRRALRATGSVVVTADGSASDSLVLELGATGRFDSVSAPAATVRLVDGGRRAHLHWPTVKSIGERVSIRIAVVHAVRGSQIVVDTAAALASWVTGWYPSPVGQSSRVDGSIRYHLPAGWRAVSNGAPGPWRSGPTGTVQEWRSRTPVDWSFAAAGYTVDSVVVPGSGTARVFTRHGGKSRTLARRYVERTGEVLAALLPVFGPYPYPGYALAEIPDGLVSWGGSSEQGFFMSTTNALGEEVNLPLLAHELSHGWWGNQVRSTGPATLLLTESLAQLGAALAIEAIEGRASALDFLRFSRDGYNSRQSARGYFALARLGHDKPLATLNGSGQDHNLSDAKGHWFYLMLRDRLGAGPFAAMQQALIRTHRDSALSLVALREAALAASPDTLRMRRFLHDWLDRPGAPDLELSWRPRSPTTIEVTITQRGDVYDLDVPVWIDPGGAEPVVRIVRSDSPTTTVVLRVTARPLGVRLDPDYRLLRWDPDYGARPGSAPRGE